MNAIMEQAWKRKTWWTSAASEIYVLTDFHKLTAWRSQTLDLQTVCMPSNFPFWWIAGWAFVWTMKRSTTRNHSQHLCFILWHRWRSLIQDGFIFESDPKHYPIVTTFNENPGTRWNQDLNFDLVLDACLLVARWHLSRNLCALYTATMSMNVWWFMYDPSNFLSFPVDKTPSRSGPSGLGLSQSVKTLRSHKCWC